MCTGCGTYTVSSTAAYALTGKSVTDHMTSQLTLSDCDAVRMIKNVSYYCEQNDPSKTYNRNGL